MENSTKQHLAKAFRKDYMKKPSPTRTINMEKIIERFNEGESITDLSIHFGIKKFELCKLLADFNITSEEIQLTIVRGKAAEKRQLNLRLDYEFYKLLEEITALVDEKVHSTVFNDIKFSLPGGPGPSISKATVAKMILQDALQKFKQEIKQ